MRVRKILAGLLVFAIIANLTSCTFVQDALYDMGIHVDVEDVAEDVSEGWNLVRDNVSETTENWVDSIISWFKNAVASSEIEDTVSDEYSLVERGQLATDAEPMLLYDLYLPLEYVDLPSANRRIYLMPLYGYGAIKATEKGTKKEISLSETGYTFVTSDEDKVEFKPDGTICAWGSGFCSLSIYKTNDDGMTELLDSIKIFVAECDFDASGSFSEFADVEKEYITLCLDLSYTLYKTDDPQAYVDINTGFFSADRILMNVNNLSDNLASVFKGEWNFGENSVRRTIASVVKEYVDEKSIQSRAVNQTEVIFKILDLISETYFSIKDAEKLPTDLDSLPSAVIEGIRKVGEFYTRVKEYGIAKDEFEYLGGLLDELFQNGELKKFFASSQKWVEFANQKRIRFDEVKEIVRDFRYFSSGNNDELVTLLFKNKNGTLDKLKVAKAVIDVGLISFENVVYVLYDYSENVGVLKKISKALSKIEGTAFEQKILNKLIQEYTGKYVTALSNQIAQISALAVEMLAGTNPIYSVSMFCLKMIASPSDSSAKEEVMALSLFASALYLTCAEKIDPFFLYGRPIGDSDELKLFVSLYLNVLLKESTAALQVSGLSTEDRQKIQDNINYIKTTLKMYL